MQLQQVGWNESWAREFARQFPQELNDHANRGAGKGLQPARVLAQHRQSYTIWTAAGEADAEVAGAFLYRATAADLPAVGDWVAVRQYSPSDVAIITGVLPRKTRFSRKGSGAVPEEQVIAANIDLLLIVCGLDCDYNMRRLERYLVAARQSGAAAVIVLNKADLCADTEIRVREVQSIAPETSVIAISATSPGAASVLERLIAPGMTAALVGSSGAGKSTMVNALISPFTPAAGASGAREAPFQETQPTRASDGRGCHTTTHRELFFLRNGGLVLDNPGLRELQLWSDDFRPHGASSPAGLSAVDQGFPEIDALAAQCAFRDCSHTAEPDCAVREALASGEIDEARWRSYLKLRRELRHATAQVDQNLRRAEKARWKKACKEVKRNQKRL